MPRPPSPHPTPLELQILKILWQQAPLMARDVQAALADAGKPLAKTSVITMLNTMFDKKYVSRKRQGNSYLFSPRVREEQVASQMLDDVVDRVFDGSTAAVMLSLFDARELDKQELQELRRRIDERLKETDS
ncbi:MAG: BlaI/MecI/CopY family transcriptional regulator [Planctomycetales bacterium]|nr:BlaI/MecI/CopY family transcriptional regulator [Planctomycetales bacterium]